MDRNFETWLGKHEVCTDLVTPAPLRRLAALLDHDRPTWPENELPPLGHWLFHLSEARQSTLGADGHSHKGGFMPPILLPRRRWAGCHTRILRDIQIGATLVRRSSIAKIESKNTASGEIGLVTVRHEILDEGEIAIEEDQTIVYLGEATPNIRSPVAIEVPRADVTRRVSVTPELLFRFSALTFNAHRIHYDREYARTHEDYAGLVVQGPLLAILLVDHFQRHRPTARISSCAFRARSPILDTDSFDLCLSEKLTGADLWVSGTSGDVKMTAEIETIP